MSAEHAWAPLPGPGGAEAGRCRPRPGDGGEEILDDLEPGPRGIEVMARQLIAHAPGRQVGGSWQNLKPLLGLGATVVRKAHVMTWDLAAREPETSWSKPHLPVGLSLEPVSNRPGAAVMAVIRAAFPPGHPDHDPAADRPGAETEFLDPFVSGARMGPFLSDASALIVDEMRGSAVAAVLLLNRTPGRPPSGGPWVTDVARDPDPRYAGTGSALLRRGLRVLFDAGDAALTLVVTDGNPAALHYARMGFTEVAVTGRVRVPG